MTPPSLFSPKDPADVAALVDGYPMAWVIAGGAAGPAASLLPLLAERDADGVVSALFGHIPKRNPLVPLLERDPRATVLVQGPHAYVSPALVSNPTWAPTWNYAAVRFAVEIGFVPDETDAALHRLAARLECGRADPWTPARMGARYGELAARVVAFRARVLETHATFKLGQDESIETFDEIVAGIGDAALANAMERARKY